MAITEVSLSLEEGLVCQLFTKSHIVAADDPADPDVEDEGPNPLEFLLAALASSADSSSLPISRRRRAASTRIDDEAGSSFWARRYSASASSLSPARRACRPRLKW